MSQTVSQQTCVICGRADAARYAQGPRVAICVDCASLPATEVRAGTMRCAFCRRRATMGLRQDDIVVCASCLNFARELTASSGAV